MVESNLGDISLLLKTGKTPPSKVAKYFEEGYNWYTPSDIGKSKTLLFSERNVSEIAVQDKKATIYPEKSLLITCIGDIGRVGISNEICSSNQQITAIKPKPEINIDYLYYWFIKNKSLLNDTSNNAVVPILNNYSLKTIKFNYPPLETQKRIAAILDDAAALRDKTQQLLTEYDQLAQSIFLEMFGDPVLNPNGWNEVKMDDVCEKVTDGTHDTPERLSEGIKFITGKHIRPYVIDYDNSDYVTYDVHREIYRRCNPELNDVLYTNIGVNLGTAALNTVNYEFSMKNVALLKPKNEYLIGRYLEYFLNSKKMKEKILWVSSIGGAQKFLSLTQLRRLKILIPPIELQNQFAEKIGLIEQQKDLAKQELKESEDLFNCLLQKAFKGELV